MISWSRSLKQEWSVVGVMVEKIRGREQMFGDCGPLFSELVLEIAYSTVGAARQSAFQILSALFDSEAGDVVAIQYLAS